MKPAIAVQLTDDGARQLQPFLAYAKKNTVGYYFRCDEVDVSGPFFTMVIDTGVDGEHGGKLSLNVPHAMVRWYVETEQESAIGFLKR
ncbi:MAG: hypothetical protein JNL19_04355 [Burkholderiales bacterium]|nr:hypothetical protein [Burkholderiales bacterium]